MKSRLRVVAAAFAVIALATLLALWLRPKNSPLVKSFLAFEDYTGGRSDLEFDPEVIQAELPLFTTSDVSSLVRIARDWKSDSLATWLYQQGYDKVWLLSRVYEFLARRDEVKDARAEIALDLLMWLG